jgi:uncharacterized protein
MNRPVHFEIHSTDPARSLAFFEKLFGWKAQKWGGPVEYWLLSTGQGIGIDGGMLLSRDGQPRTVNTIEVESVDAMMEKVAAAGGQIVVPKMAIPGVGWLAYGVDPTGNLFGMMEHDPGAA